MDYPAKFARIAEKTSFRLLDADARAFVGDMANRYRFTLQELQLVSDMALDRSRWKEQPLGEDWPDEGDKSALIRALVRSHGQVRDREKSYAAFSSADKPKAVKPEIRVASKPNLGLGRCPVASERTRCCNLMTLDAVERCGFDCSYCSIQSFYHGNAVTFDGTFPEKLAALVLDPDRTYHIGTGQSSDSLMWGNHNRVLEALARFARDNPNVLLELKTKSRNIGWLLENDYPPNILTTWSLNPQTIIDHEEHLTASLAQRLDAAGKIAAKGRLVGFHFHPIVHYDRWREDYGAICRELVSRFTPGQVTTVSLGTLTFTRSVMKTIRRRPLASKILQMPMEEIAGKYSYPLAVKTELFRHVYGVLSPWHGRVFFYLCMEAEELWNPVFGHAYASNGAFEEAMKAAYFAKVGALD
ncbi:MAG: DNA photolyase [Gammaproteobacteria bacterium]|nr:DNA photolyase [Gammaproteobacteria bacterium]